MASRTPLSPLSSLRALYGTEDPNAPKAPKPGATVPERPFYRPPLPDALRAIVSGRTAPPDTPTLEAPGTLPVRRLPRPEIHGTRQEGVQSLLTMLGLTPAGVAISAYDAGHGLGSGDKLETGLGLAGLALAAIPGGRVASKADDALGELRAVMGNEARLAEGAPDLGEAANSLRATFQNKLRDYVGRPTNDAPADAFGRAVFPGKVEGVDPRFHSEVAAAYDKAVSNPHDPKVKAAYQAFAKEIEDQYKFVTEELGIRMEPSDADPYRGPNGGPDSKLMAKDLFENKRLKTFTGGAEHPLLTPEQNVKFRFIHDVLGHGLFGNTFAARGEEGAFRAHAETFSDLARQALATETRGQNSWVNFGPNSHLPAAQRPFAEQKAFLLPEHMTRSAVPTLDAGQGASRRARSLLGSDKAADATAAEIEATLSPDEIKSFRRNRENALNAYSRGPTPRALASAVLRGAEARGSVRSSGDAIHQAFGPDAPRFTALFAAQSPQNSVENNLKLSLDTWGKWLDSGRTTDPDAIRALMGPSALEAHVPNTIRALTHTDEHLMNAGFKDILSGPKVSPFYANLMGDVQRVTHDTHMARAYGTDPQTISTPARNLAMTALVRNTAKEVEKITGEKVTPREAQEMAWSFIRAITPDPLSDRTPEMPQTAEALLRRSLDKPESLLQYAKGAADREMGSTLAGRIGTNASVGKLMEKPEFARLLENLGLEQPVPSALEGLKVDPSHIRNADLLDIAQRIDRVKRGAPLFVAGGLLGAGLWDQANQRR